MLFFLFCFILDNACWALGSHIMVMTFGPNKTTGAGRGLGYCIATMTMTGCMVTTLHMANECQAHEQMDLFSLQDIVSICGAMWSHSVVGYHSGF